MVAKDPITIEFNRYLGLSAAAIFAVIILYISPAPDSLRTAGQHKRGFINLHTSSSIRISKAHTSSSSSVNGPPGCAALASSVPVIYTCNDLKNISQTYTVLGELNDGKQAVAADVVHDGNSHHYVARFPNKFHENDKDIDFGRLLCGARHVAQLVDFTCHKGLTLQDYRAALLQEKLGKKPIDTRQNYVSIYEKCPGDNLNSMFPDTVECTKLSYNEIRSIVRQVYEALVDIHKRGVIHRDIVGNILYDRDSGSICVIDFGLGRLLPQWLVETSAADLDATQLEMYGYNETVRWGADHIRVDYADDILALGGLVGKMLSLPIPWRPEVDGIDLFARQVVTMLGSRDLKQLQKKYEWYKLPPNITAQLPSVPAKRANWRKKYSNKCNKKLLTDDALSFLDGLLQYSYVKRRNFFLTAAEHPFILEER